MAVQRVVAYIDGFNFYHGLMDAKLDTSRWLDLNAMCQKLLSAQQRLTLVRYFTTRIRNDSGKHSRQNRYIDALTARGGVSIDYGHFLSRPARCRSCGAKWQRNEEKKTDVNIAVRLLEDAFDDLFDVAIIVSGDSDLAPPIQSVRHRFPKKTVVVAHPPKRSSAELARVAHGAYHINPSQVRSARLPDPVVLANGHALRAPKGWLPQA